MAIPSETIADKTFSQIESQAALMYREAKKDIASKISDFTRHHRAKDKEMQKGLKKGTVTQAQYQSWLKGQIFIGNQWRSKKDSINATIAHVMNEASAIVHDRSKEVFTENANYTAYEIEKDYNGAINFNLYDKTTVDMLLRDDPELLIRRTDADGNKLDAWNTKTIDNAISQGIIQGESIDQISDRIARNLCIKANRSTLMYARTAMTCAQNAGRIERMRDAEEAGIKILKVWISTMDERTRSAHQQLDGQEVPVNQPFSSELGPIDHPGDPNADEANVWNCRCSLGYNYPEHRNRDIERTAYYEEGDPEYDPDHRNYETVCNMNYEQWVEYKQNQIRARYGGEQKPVSKSEEPTFRQPTKDEYDGGEKALEQERQKLREVEEQRQKIKDQIEADRNRIEEIRRERRRLDDLAIARGPMGTDYSGYDAYQTKADYDKYRDDLANELKKIYNELDSMKRPKVADYASEDEYYVALEKYRNRHDQLWADIETKSKELANMPEYSKVETWREARSLGEAGIEARRRELDREMADITARRDTLTKQDEDLYKEQSGYFHAKLVDKAESRGIEYSIPTKLETPNSTDTIVERVGGGDMTEGSCASLGFCYVGQTEGYDILDFRDGESRELFARYCDDVLRGISRETGKPLLTESTNTGTGGSVRLIKQTTPGHEYYFSCGRHAAIVRSNEDGRLEYLELQSRFQNGWKLLGYKDDRKSMDYTFTHRFGCSRGVSGTAYMMDVEDMRGSKILHRAMGYINTAEDQQKKGATGHEK